MRILDLFKKHKRIDRAAPRVRVTIQLGSCCAVLTPEGWRARNL